MLDREICPALAGGGGHNVAGKARRVFSLTHWAQAGHGPGCGQAGWQVTGVDFAPRAIQLAKQKLRSTKTQAELYVSDATHLKGVVGPYEFALDIGCFHSIPKAGKADYLQQLDRILAPNGFWLMYGFCISDARPVRTGLDNADISLISSQLTPVSRLDGFDDKRSRASAWFLFQKK